MSILEELWYGNIKPCEDKEISDEEKKLVPELGKMKLSEISTVTCQQLINKLYTDGRSRGRTKKGTLSLEQGIDIKTVSHMLGHTDAGFTMNTYMHVTDDMQQSAANTIGSLLDESTKNSKVVKFPA